MDIHQVACCYHPTTLILVDDNKQYHNLISLAVDSHKAYCQFYDDSKKALQFLKEEYAHNPFTSRCILGSEDSPSNRRNVQIDIRTIRQEIYNPHRFKEISIVILDFAMPGMNGGELAHQLKGMPFKIILLTGEADTQVAVKLFNEGVIHSYIRKDEPHFELLLNKTINNLQKEYFCDLSAVIINSLVQAPDIKHIWFNDLAFKALLDRSCNENDITEYYLLDEYGSFLLLNSQGKPNWLIVSNEAQLKGFCQFAEFGDNVPDAVLKALKDKEKIPYFHTDQDWETPPAQWEKYMHSAKVLQGRETYYYAYITDPKAYDIQPDKILSYQQFIDN